MIKKIFVFVFILLTYSFAQQHVDEFARAVKLFGDKEYSAAYEIFSKLSGDKNVEIQKKSYAKYYAGDCLLNLNELDGAAIEFENFISTYKFSNLRENAYYKLGSIYFTKGEYRKSREALLYLVNAYPESEFAGSAYYWIAEAYAGENKFFEAEEYFKEAISARTTNKFIVNSMYSLAQLYEKLGNYTSAVTYYDELLAYYKDDPLGPKAQWRIGICYFNLKEYDSAVLELSDPLIKNLSTSEQHEVNYFLANAFVRLKEYKNALSIYEEILQNDLTPDFKEKVLYSQAWVNFQLGNYEKSFDIFDGINKNYDDSLAVNALFWSGEAKRYLGDTKTANEIFKIFVEKYPSSILASRAQFSMGTIYYTIDNSGDAEKSLLNASVSNDGLTKGKANTLLGEMRLNQKQFDKAQNYFQTAVKFTKGSGELNNRAVLGLAVTQFYLNDIDEAIKGLEYLEKYSKDFETDKVNFYLAECYLVVGKYSAALKHYNLVKSNEEEFKRQTLYGKAYAYFNLKDYPNAIYYFNDFINKYKKDRNVGDAKLRLADSYYGIKNFNKASAIYSELFSSNRAFMDNDLTYYQYCQALYKAGKSSDAIEEFQNLQRRFPNSKYADVSQYVIGWIHFQQSDYSNAIANYFKLISKYPNSSLIPIAYYSLGDSYFNEGQYDTSIVFYNKVLQDYPNTPYILDAVNGIQYAYVAKEEPGEAVTFIDNFVANNPASKYGDQIYFKKGDILYSSEKYSDAIQAYKDFLSKFPSSNFVPNAYYWMGKSAANLKNVNEAINNFNVVVNRWPKNDMGISAAIELANIYSEGKNYNAVIQLMDKATAAVPTSNRLPELLYIKGTAEVKNNLLQNAYETFDQIIKYYDSSVFSAKAKIELGILEMNRNQYENAQLLFKELGEKRTDDIGAQAQYYYGLSLFNQNKITDAITAFVRVRSVFAGFDEWYTKSLLKLGDCYVKLKDKKQARDMYRAVIERHKTGELAQEAKRKLNQL